MDSFGKGFGFVLGAATAIYVIDRLTGQNMAKSLGLEDDEDEAKESKPKKKAGAS